jgi:hypothetical protein
MLFWSRFFLICFRRRSDGGGWGSGTWLAKPVQRNDHGVFGIHRPVRKRGGRERGEERRGERGVFFSSVE